MGPKSEYASYLARPDIRSLWCLEPASSAKGRCSYACVPKRSGHELRKILQVCPMNDAMWDVEHCIGADPAYGLQGCGALSQLSVGEDVTCCACLDQSNAFTYIEVPPWWLPYQAAPSIEAGNLPKDWQMSQAAR